MGQEYFPVAIIDKKNKLQLVNYNRGIVRNDEIATEAAPGKSEFQVDNLKKRVFFSFNNKKEESGCAKLMMQYSLGLDMPLYVFGLLDEIALSESIIQILDSYSVSKSSINISILDYDGSSIKVEFKYSGCTSSQFVSALFESYMIKNISENGVDDWIPLDTQSLVLLYPDYDKETPSEPNTSANFNIPTVGSSESISTNSLSSNLNDFDWRYAHFEESFRSFTSKDKSKFNIRREGVVVISVIRDWLVTEKLQNFMQNLLLFTDIISYYGHSQTKLVFWVLARFKQIVDGFQAANQLYGRLAQYQTHFREVFADHCAQMEAHLKALQDNISAILNGDSSDIESRIINLAEILVVSTKTMLAFTVALQTRLKELSSLRESTHRKLLANVVIAATGLGMAYYTSSSSRITARAAQLTTVVGGCTLIYYYHQFNTELEILVSEQTSIIDQAVDLTSALQRHSNLWAKHAISTTNSSATLPILYSHLSLLQTDLQQLRSTFTISPTTNNPTSITWW